MSRLKNIIAAAALILSVNLTAAASDLSDWAVNDYIESNSTGLLSRDLISNNLKSNITREEFCELTINLYEKITDENLRVPPTSPFTDCDNVSVTKAYYNGIVTGVTDTTFEPQRSVTRQEMAKILVNTLNAAEVNIALTTSDAMAHIQSFADCDSVSDWAQSAMATMVMHNLLSGNEFNQIMPLRETTREQAMICVNRCYRTFDGDFNNAYTLPEVTVSTEESFGDAVVIDWSEVPGATEYYVNVKNSAGNQVFACEVDSLTNQYSLPHSITGEGKFSVTIGAKTETEDSVFSIPKDFNVETSSQQIPVTTPASTPEQAATTSEQIYIPHDEYVSEKAKALLEEAAKYIGINYLYGGTTPAGFDCSGYVKYVFNECGIKLERVSRDQYAKNGTPVAKADLLPGDLLFFGVGGTVNHVGIYAGNGQMIHSPSTGKSICYTSINSDYYVSHYIGARRIF